MTAIPTRAIILAAGLGRRLGSASASRPKPLTPIVSVPIIHRSIGALARAGVSEVVVVTGHLDGMVRASLGEEFAGVSVYYVHNDRYRETSDAHSLWAARDWLDRSVFLLEGDIVLQPDVFAAVALAKSPNLIFAGVPARRLRGSVVSATADGALSAYLTDRDQGPDFDWDGWLKTSNVYLFDGDYLQRGFCPALEAEVARTRDGENGYYDYAIADSVAEGEWGVCVLSPDAWYEVDDPGDRMQAEFLFSDAREQRRLLGELHGSYWRFDVHDHLLLCNVHFPTPDVFAALLPNIRSLLVDYPAGHALQSQLAASVAAVDPAFVSVSNGSAELIKLLRDVRGPVAVPVPGFNEYENVLLPGQLVPFELVPPSFRLDMDSYASLVRERACQVAVVVSPNNPTSVAEPLAEIRRLCQLLPDVTVVVDESFVDFAAPPAGSLLPYLEEHPNAVVLKSLSKVYGIGGIRLGFSATSDPRRARWIRRRLPIWNVSGIAEEFLRVLPHFQRDFLRSCEMVQTDARNLAKGLSKIADLSVVPPDANFVFVGLPAGLSATHVADELFVRSRVLVKDCEGKTMRDGHRWLRIASRTRSENQRVIDELEELVPKMARSL